MNPYALNMPHWPKLLAPEPLGTPSQRVRQLLTRLGHPEQRLPPVVHVGGTKGKGSTIAFLRAMLEAAGLRVHVYSSPHLARFNERIVLAGKEIDDDLLYSVIEETRIAAGDMPVGFFDATTAAAMLAFARIPADIVLMEMGLGGAVDATNILDNPRLTVLTTLSYDHTEYMGSTLEEIARFEAGILKPGVPCIVSYQHERALSALEQEAEARAAPLYQYGRHWRTRREADHMVFSDAHGEARLPLPALLGAHQVVNAGNAIAALTALEEFDVPHAAIEAGLRSARWKGRLERMGCGFLPGACEIWFDGGHNHAAAEVMAFHARTHWQDKPFYLIFGTTQGKDIPSMIAPFAELAQRAYGVGVKSEPKSYSAAAAAQSAATLMPAEAADSIRDALEDIRAREAYPFRALVFGSLYLWLEASML